jgi:hypothetical protein
MSNRYLTLSKPILLEETIFKRIRKRKQPFLACVRVDLVSALAMTRAPRLTIATTSLTSSSFACDVGHHHSPVLTRAGEASGTVLSCKFK